MSDITASSPAGHPAAEALTASIKAEARRLGFAACGVARADRVSADEEAYLRRWLSEGRHADMHYMTNYLDKRLDPRLLMPGLKSIVSVAINYAPHRRLAPGEPQIAAYALGKDYHDVVRQRLHQLAAFVAAATGRPDLAYRAFVDSAPVLERYWAVQAGLGWVGRNRLLIIPQAGSEFFLGELFLDIPLVYDRPLANHCGHCHRCTDRCPTHALTADGLFDARRCLSYQTIENRGALSALAQAEMGEFIYGCDRCQQACPWNRFAQPTDVADFHASDELLAMTREQWEHLSEDDYRRLFKGSAVKRAKYAGLMRNIRNYSEHAADAGPDSPPADDAHFLPPAQKK